MMAQQKIIPCAMATVEVADAVVAEHTTKNPNSNFHGMIMFPCSDVALVLSIFTSEFETEYEGEQQYLVASSCLYERMLQAPDLDNLENFMGRWNLDFKKKCHIH
jgi:hypothetical protein